MLLDRPDMQNAIPVSHNVYGWIVAGFNGDRLGQRIYWNAATPQTGRPAEHGQPYGAYPAYIAVSGGTETTAIDKWASVVYEMFNLENNEEFERIYELAVDEKIDAEEFADKCVKLEFVAIDKTRDFFRANPLPTSRHGKDTWYNWVISDRKHYDEYRQSFDSPGENSFNSNFAYFREYYNTTLLPYGDAMRRTKRWTEAAVDDSRK
jgi:hypothetical protein